MSDNQLKLINDVKQKIQREKNIIDSSTKIRESSDNISLKQKCNSNIREAKQNLEYLNKTLRDLQLSQESATNANLGATSTGHAIPHNPPNFTRLDLIKYDCPSLGHRIQYMLQLLEFKLQIENQYKAATEKMIQLYKSDSDRLSSNAAIGGKIEINRKIPLLTRALKRYKDMYLDIDDLKQDTDEINNRVLRAQKNTVGIITIGISNLKDIDHIVSNSGLLSKKKTESIINIKVDDELKVKSRPFRNGRLSEPLQWQINIDKNNEIEITVCDKVGNEWVPVAIIWFIITDIVEELRRKRQYQENYSNGWVSASNLSSSRAVSSNSGGLGSTAPLTLGSPVIDSNKPVNNSFNAPSSTTSTTSNDNVTSTNWYVLEPNGQILLSFGFTKTDRASSRNSDFNDGLGRHGAIRERKEDVHEQHGHHFVQRNFYNVMMCAYCGEFARYSCYQCQECKYLCHKKCYSKVVTKCISSSTNSDSSIEDETSSLKYKIPHRFEAVSNRGTKWCCHCGFILPWGKKNIRKCSECGIMCHTGCAHLVPDFCGMSMIMANTILTTIMESKKNISSSKNVKKRPTAGFALNTSVSGHQKSSSIVMSPVENSSAMNTPFSSPPISYPTTHEVQSLKNDNKNNYGRIPPPTDDYSSQQKMPPPIPEKRVANIPYPEEDPFNVGHDMSQGSANAPPPIPNIVVNNDYDQTDSFMTNEYSRPDQQAPSNNEKYLSGGNMANYADSIHLAEHPNPFDSNYSNTDLPTGVHTGAEIIDTKNSNTYTSFGHHENQQSFVSGSTTSNDVGATATSSNDTSNISPVKDRNMYYNNYNSDNVDKRLTQISSGAFDYQAIPNAQLQTTAALAYGHDNSGHDNGAGTVATDVPSVATSTSGSMGGSASAAASARSKRDKPRRRKVGLNDFQFLAVLGKGNFGKVMLAESRNAKRLCAIKVLKKDFVIENDEIESLGSEKSVLLTASKKSHPFLIHLHCCFQTANRIYFVMEYVSGGDLMWHIQKARFSQRRAQFYAAEVLLGLEYFHQCGIVYRDLKLDNILLTTDGHIKIADYGLCKEDMWYGNTTSTFCGTPEFMAPEILKEQRYGKAVDWWAFGVLLYQMLLGQSPFRGRDEDEIFNAILTDEPLYPIQMARESVEILQALLTRDPSKRLGGGPRDSQELKEHPYFRNINFDDVLALKVAPPYLPEIKNEHDVSNFDDEFTAETPRLTPVNSTLSSSMQEKFRGFSEMCDEKFFEE